MSTMRILRSRDILLSVNGESLFGVTDFFCESDYSSYGIMEYLSETPFETVSSGGNHKIVIRTLSLFKNAFPENFTLTVSDGTEEFRFEDCALKKETRTAAQGKYAEDVFEIRAGKLTVRRNADEQ